MSGYKYGHAHRKMRAALRSRIDLGGVCCCLCGGELLPGAPFDLDHMPGTHGYRGPAHPYCNRSEGASRGNRARRNGPEPPRRLVL